MPGTKYPSCCVPCVTLQLSDGRSKHPQALSAAETLLLASCLATAAVDKCLVTDRRALSLGDEQGSSWSSFVRRSLVWPARADRRGSPLPNFNPTLAHPVSLTNRPPSRG